jgi:hypothetical protein
MPQDVCELERMQLAVDWHCAQASLPAREKRLDVFAAVACHQRNAIADMKPGTYTSTRKARHSRRERAIVVPHRATDGDRGERWEAPRAAEKQRRDIMRGGS